LSEKIRGSAVDLADVVERTRDLKRRLASGRLAFNPDELFKEPFVHAPHLMKIRDKLDDIIASQPDQRAEALDCRGLLDAILAALESGPPCPTEDELCRRFSKREIDARTVLQITGWTLEELYDACSRRGLPID
jgi:hypothetical protein